MAAAGTAPNDFETLTGRNPLRAFLIAADFLQEERRPDAEGAGQSDQSFQTRRHMPGLEPTQHTGTDAGRGRNIRQRQSLAFTHSSRDGPELPPDTERRGGGRGAAARTGARNRFLGKTRHARPLYFP
jgi:hypothetical protein